MIDFVQKTVGHHTNLLGLFICDTYEINSLIEGRSFSPYIFSKLVFIAILSYNFLKIFTIQWKGGSFRISFNLILAQACLWGFLWLFHTKYQPIREGCHWISLRYKFYLSTPAGFLEEYIPLMSGLMLRWLFLNVIYIEWQAEKKLTSMR